MVILKVCLVLIICFSSFRIFTEQGCKALCGRYSEVSSHPETQVPIALRKAQGAPPLPEYIFFCSTSFPENQKAEISFLWISPHNQTVFCLPTMALSISGIRVEGVSFLSARLHRLPRILSCKIKTGSNLLRYFLQKSMSDFLRRHYPYQVKGSKFGYFLSACFTSSPVFII